MPIKFQFKQENMLKTIESLQKEIDKKSFDQLSDVDKKEYYASLFASRSAANAERGKKNSLKVGTTVSVWEQKRDELVRSSTFQTFLEEKGHDKMKELLLDGHGGAAEDEFQKYVMDQAKLPADVPDRYMPTAAERIKQQQKKLDNLDPRSDKAIEIYAEIFRTRRAVGAVRKKSSTVEPRVNGKKYGETEDLTDNEVFRGFIKQYGGALRSEAQTGNAGAAEEMFQDHLLKMDHIPSGAPKDYMPTAVNRIDMLKTRIQAGGTQKEQSLRCTEIMATREAVSAVRGDKKSLEPQINPDKLDSAYDKWSKCATFQEFLKTKSAEAIAAATTGHGGKLQDAFREYVMNLDHIPSDVPEAYMPDADKRLETLKEKYKAADYNGKSPEYKLALAAEVMATREVVQAVRKDSSSLKKPVNPAELNESVQRWTGCKAFKDFVEKQPAKVREGGSTGHGGLMGDQFKEYVLSRDALEDDIPIDFMPTAGARIDVLKKKIRDNVNPTPEQKQQLYAELMATRGTVDAVRKKTDNLNKPVDPVTLAEQREKLTKSAAFQNFVKDPVISDELRLAAVEERGHGGALEDKFKDYVVNLDVLPEDVPERYQPTAFDRTEALQKKIKAPGFDEKENAADVYLELMATRDAVNAKRGKADSLKVTVNPERLKEAKEKWAKCDAFRKFVNDPDSGAKTAATTGHGGALADKFKEYVTKMEVIPEDVPEEMLPDAQQRINGLKSRLKTMDPIFTEPEEYASLYAQILATRKSVGAIPEDKDTPKKKVDPKEVKRIADGLINCSAFQDYLKDNEDVARRFAGQGRGFELEKSFKNYLLTTIPLLDDVPEEYVPTAMERIEGVQAQIAGKKFDEVSVDVKVGVLAELIGARRSVEAERNKPETLKHSLKTKEAKETAEKMRKCSAFREFVEKNPEAAKKAALSGHGGALEDAFKDYVKNMDRIPDDVPKEFMPTALERTEILQKKIESGAFSKKNFAEQNAIYKELVATRAAVDSIRGDKKSLNATVDAQKLGDIRRQIYSPGTADTFFDDANRRVLKDAATSGHGGALEDKLKEDVLRQAVAGGVLPPTPERFRPTAEQFRERLKQNLESELNVENNPIFDVEKETAMKKVASAMYLSKLEKQAKDNNEPNPVVNPDDMKQNVDKLMKSKAFKMMFDGAEAARDTVTNVKNGRMSSVFEVLDNNKAILDEQRRQKENLAQQRLNAQRELDEQRRQRNNSMHVNRNPNANRQNQQNQEANRIEQPAVQNEQNQNEPQPRRRNSVNVERNNEGPQILI